MTPRNEHIVHLYERYATTIVAITRRHKLPRAVAEDLVHDIFVSLVQRYDEIEDYERWLIGAACNLCRQYKRQQQSVVRLPAGLEVTPDYVTSVTIRQVLERSPPRVADILYRRYIEGLTAKELATAFKSTPGYIYLLTHRSIKVARRSSEVPSERRI